MRRALVVLAVLALAIGSLATPPVKADCAGGNVTVEPYAFETITVADSSVGFTVAKYAPTGERRAGVAVVTVETAPFRWRADGTAPTNTVGHLSEAFSSLQVCGATAIRQWRGIRTTGSSSTIHVTYFRAP